MQLKMFQYRIYPSRIHQSRLLKQFSLCKEVYNTMLGLNKKLMLTKKFDMDSIIKDIKIATPELKAVHSQVLQNVSDRLSKAFDNFFARCKTHARKKGYPRFKSRISSITYPQSGFKFLSNKRLQCSKIGSMPIILHRLPKGKVKTLTIKQRANQWYAVLSCEVDEPKVKHPSKAKVGIDVGLESFATLSDGSQIVNPRYFRQGEERLRRLQRSLSRKKKGSRNRVKAKLLVARQHMKVANRRADFLQKLSRNLTLQYGTIAVEQLNIRNMVKNHCVAKSISDAGWGTFIRMLSYKAITSGGQVLLNPRTRGSSMRCSGCGREAKMPLSKRTYRCGCGVVLHRDHNAALNHLNDTLGLRGISTPVETAPLPSLSAKASAVDESGTICDES